MNKEQKQEASIPVQSRVNIVDLANLVMYWESKGYSMRSMSQLVAWSISLTYEGLKASGEITEPIDKVSDAHRLLAAKQLYQGSLRDRAFKKLGTAMRFESLREEGVDPTMYVSQQYNMVHNRNSVEPVIFNRGEPTQEELNREAERLWTEAKLKKQRAEYEENQRKKDAKIKADAMKAARDSGAIVDSDSDKEWIDDKAPRKLTMEEIEKKEAEVLKRDEETYKQLNDLDAQLEFMKKNVVKGENE
jgi:hypothetical protein